MIAVSLGGVCQRSIWLQSLTKMNDPLWLESTGLQAKTLAKEYFDVEVCANKFIQILEATSCHAQIDIEKLCLRSSNHKEMITFES